MYAHHFYSGKGGKYLHDFLAKHRRIVIVVDPPFGGLITPLARSIDLIRDVHSKAYETIGDGCVCMLKTFINLKFQQTTVDKCNVNCSVFPRTQSTIVFTIDVDD